MLGGSKDIAIAKLARDITFIPGILEPICLPSGDDRSDIPASGQITFYCRSNHVKVLGCKNTKLIFL